MCSNLVGPLKAKGHCSKCILCGYRWKTDKSYCTYDDSDVTAVIEDTKVTNYDCPFLYMHRCKELHSKIRYLIYQAEGDNDNGNNKSSNTDGKDI